MRSFITSVGGRKVVGFLLCLIVLGGLAATDHLSTIAADGIVWLFTALVGGNGMEHLATAWASRTKPDLLPGDETDGSPG